MNINMANSQYIDLFGRGNSVGKLSSARVSGGEKISSQRISTPGISEDDLACSVSISEESKALSEELNEEKKQDELNEEKQQEGTGVITDHESIIRNGETRKIAIATFDFASDKHRFIFEAYQADDWENAGTLNFGRLASAYKETVEGLNSQFSGKYLEEALTMLDKEYKDALDYIANAVKIGINFGEKTEGKEGEVSAIEAIFGLKINDFQNMLSEMGLDKNKPILDNIDAIIKILAQQAEESII